MPQGYHESKDPVTGKAPEHQQSALKFTDISNAEIMPLITTQKSISGRKPVGYWTDELIISELKKIIEEIRHFPSKPDLINMNKGGLGGAIDKHGGIRKFQEILGYKSKRKIWIEEDIISELKEIIEETGYFPSRGDLININKTRLANAISTHGGYFKFQEILGYEPKLKSWNEEDIIAELKLIIEETGDFPSGTDLINMKKNGLGNAISKQGGYYKFQEILGYGPKVTMWSDEVIISELKEIINEMGYFPSVSELERTNKYGLVAAIYKHGNLSKFKEVLGYNVSLQDKYISELMSYTNKRGKASENIVKKVITEWSEIHNKPLPDFNVKLAKGNVIEFVCDNNKRIGIDITNTKASKQSTIKTISRKWRYKDYRLYLDELWIVVFTDVLSSEDYGKLNVISPDNVKIFSIETFLEELDYSTTLCDMNKINRFKNCTFHTKDELKNRN